MCVFWQQHASTIATCPVLSINNGRESEGGDKGFFVSSLWFSSIVVGWRKLSRLSRLSRLCALVRELSEIDGQSSAGSHPWLEASSFHLSSYSSYTPVLFLLYLSRLNSAYAPFFIPQSHMITALQACRIKGFKGHKLSSEWIFFQRELFFFYERGICGEIDRRSAILGLV